VGRAGGEGVVIGFSLRLPFPLGLAVGPTEGERPLELSQVSSPQNP